MRARDPHEVHRAATPLELFFDLCFVVAIALAASELHHGIVDGNVVESIRSYALAFFAIWWAWVNFTWFASAYDSDDAPYRLLVFLQMIGVLVLAAGVPRAFEHLDYGFVTLGYAIMRIGLVVQWLRAARSDHPRRRTALRYAVGITLCQIAWIGLLLVPPETWVAGWLVLAPLEMIVPVWAEHAAPTTWHPHHIAERYGLLTLIVLGESVLAATIAIQSGLDAGYPPAALVRTIVGGLLILFSMWWLYFDVPGHRVLTSSRRAFQWGYAHYLVFGSVAAVGAGISVYADVIAGHGHVSRVVAGSSVTLPVAVFLMLVWWLLCRPTRPGRTTDAAFFTAAAGILAAPLTPYPVLTTGVVLAALVALRASAASRSVAATSS